MRRSARRSSRAGPTSARCTPSRTSRSRTRTSRRADRLRGEKPLPQGRREPVVLGTRATEDAAGDGFAAGIPPTALVLVGIGSVQFGSAIARTLFDDVGPGGAVLLRIGFA